MDKFSEGGSERCAACDEPVDVWLAGVVPAVLWRHAAGVQDPHPFRLPGARLCGQEGTQGRVDVLRLFWRGDEACANSPHGLVRYGHHLPVLDLREHRCQLLSQHLGGPTLLTISKEFP